MKDSGYGWFTVVRIFCGGEGFPASRGLSRRGKNERKERDLCSFLSFLPRRERPLLAGKGGGVANLTQNNVKLQKIHLFSYSRKGFELS